jgi:transposase InsO family protein
MAAISISTTDSPILTINAATTINEKLTPSTFPQWRAQFEALLIGYDLLDFVTGVKKCPAIDASNSAASKAANSHWVRQDKLILHAILASTSTTITPLLVAYKTSHEAWTALTRLYAGKSRTRAMQLKEDLTLSTRGNRTVTEFLQAIKMIVDDLAIIDHPVSDDDLTLYILNGLGPEFKEIAAPIRARETSLKFEEIHDLLVGHESYLRRLENQLAATFIPTANYSHRQGGAPGQHKPSPKSSFNKTCSNNWHHKNRPSNSGQRRYKPKCQWCDQVGHTAKNCPKMSSAEFTANCAASSLGKNQKWLVDSAASHNMTTELSSLLINSEYDGTDEVVIGDGSGLPVSHIGSLSLASSNRVFHLRDTLCVHERTTTDGWHKRLGHPLSKLVHHLIHAFSLPTNKNGHLSLCTSCSQNKAHRQTFNTHGLTSTAPLELIYTDVWGPSHEIGIDGSKYYVIFVDHYTKYIWLYPMTHKSNVQTIFPQFRNLVENKFNTKIKCLYSDNGGEYIGLKSYLSIHGISHYTTAPHTPQQNGMSERRHRHLVETGLTLLTDAHMPLSYWPYAFQTVAYLINRMPTSTLNNQSPFEKLFQQIPNYLKLKQFGCLCYPLTRPYNQHKLEPKAKSCTFVGYSLSQNAYLCLEPNTRKIFHSWHVIFHEGTFPFQKSTTNTPLPVSTPSAVDAFSVPISLPQVLLAPLGTTDTPDVGTEVSPPSVNGSSPEPPPLQVSTLSSSPLISSQISPLRVHEPAVSEPDELRTHIMTTRSMNNIYKPKKSF